MMQDNEKIEINGIIYEYSKYYDRLESERDEIPGVLCPKCYNDTFQLSYGNYEIIAHCKCGHSMTVYDG